MLHCFLFSIKIYARLYTICLIRGEAVCQQIERTDCPTRLSVRAKKKQPQKRLFISMLFMHELLIGLIMLGIHKDLSAYQSQACLLH